MIFSLSRQGQNIGRKALRDKEKRGIIFYQYNVPNGTMSRLVQFSTNITFFLGQKLN